MTASFGSLAGLSPEIRADIMAHMRRLESGWFIYRQPTIGPNPHTVLLRRRDSEGALIREIPIRTKGAYRK